MITQKSLGQMIKKSREQRALSQEQLAHSLNISRVAVSDIERGIRSLSAIELFQVAKVFDVSLEDFIQMSNIEKKPSSKTEMTFKPEILRHLILYILEKCGGKPNIGETVLYKLLYFIDFNHFERFGESVTGMHYIKLQHGPVPRSSEYNLVIEQMKSSKEIVIIRQNYYGRIQKRYVAMCEANREIIQSFLITIEDVLNNLSHMNATMIEEYVHGDIPWKATAMKETIHYQLVYERIEPYSQKKYDEMLRQASSEDVLNSLGEFSDQELNYYQNIS